MGIQQNKKKKSRRKISGEKLVFLSISLIIMIVTAPFIIGLMLIRGKHYHNTEMYSKS